MSTSLGTWLTGWGQAESISLGERIVGLWANLAHQPG